MSVVNNVKERKLQFDNQNFNSRHRKYGRELYSMDIDMIEFNKYCEPEILSETKHGCQTSIDLNSYQCKSQRNVADKLGIPYFIVLYYYPGLNEANGKVDEFGTTHKYIMVPGNQIALGYTFGSVKPTLFSEHSFVQFLYMVKKLEMPADLNLDQSMDIKPKLPIVYGTHSLCVTAVKEVA